MAMIGRQLPGPAETLVVHTRIKTHKFKSHDPIPLVMDNIRLPKHARLIYLHAWFDPTCGHWDNRMEWDEL